MTAGNDFFEESREQSRVKAEIVSKYFWAWAKVILPHVKTHGRRIGYIDLFAGRGEYKDGRKSTPLLILEKAIQDTDMQQMLVTIFNDIDPSNSHVLKSAIESLPGVQHLRYSPQTSTMEVGDDVAQTFERMRLIPSLVFLDPWGYKGLSLSLINSILKDWACECILFFNYNRINPALNNDAVSQRMDDLFGNERASLLRHQLRLVHHPHERETLILHELRNALTEMYGRYVIAFRFRNDEGTRTSHYLIFVTKHPKGYKIMKEIMAKQSSTFVQDVPSFEFCLADRSKPRLELERPLDDLAEMLLRDFAGQRSTKSIMWACLILKPITKKRY